VADEGVPMLDIATVLARQLNTRAVSIEPRDAAAHFGFIATFAGIDMPASSAKTRSELGWKPTEIGLIADISAPGYFTSRHE